MFFFNSRVSSHVSRAKFEDRLMVGRQVLALVIMVRIHVLEICRRSPGNWGSHPYSRGLEKHEESVSIDVTYRG